MQEAQPLDRLFLALADPGRRGMVEQLSRGPATVKELAGPANMRLPSALKHLKVLEEGGMVVSRKVGRTRTYAMRRDQTVRRPNASGVPEAKRPKMRTLSACKTISRPLTDQLLRDRAAAAANPAQWIITSRA